VWEVWQGAQALWNAAGEALAGLPKLWRISALAALAVGVLGGATLRVLVRRGRRDKQRVAQRSTATLPAVRTQPAAITPTAAVTATHQGVAKALRRIEACRAARSEELDLGGLQLTTLDEVLNPLCALTWLKRLYLGPSAEAREKPEKSRNWPS
jgi:hypothetical protein